MDKTVEEIYSGESNHGNIHEYCEHCSQCVPCGDCECVGGDHEID